MKMRHLRIVSATLAILFLSSVVFISAAADSHPTPVLSLNLEKEILEGAEPGAEYQYSTNSGSTWRAFVADTSGYLSISSILYGTDIKLLVRRAASNSLIASDAMHLDLPKKTSGPTAAEVKVSYSGAAEDMAKFLINSSGRTIEYRKAFTSEWIECAGSELEVDAPSAVERTITYSFRYKGGGVESPSSTVNRTLYSKKTAPSIGFSLVNEVISNIQRGKMEIALDEDTDYADVEDFSPHYDLASNKIYLKDLIDGINTPETRVLRIRLKGTESAPPSYDRPITLFGRREAPDQSTLAYDIAKMKIRGITSQMEYRLKPPASEYNTRKWSSTTKEELDISKFVSALEPVDIEFRFKASKTTAASEITEITLAQLEDGPDVEINMEEQRLEGLNAYENYQYSKNNKTFTSFTADQYGYYSIARLLGSSGFKLFVRKAATQSEPYTAATEVSVGKITSLSTVFKLEYSETTVKILGTTTDMEYRIPPSKEWLLCDESDMELAMPDKDTTIAIRVAGANGKSPSAEKSVKISSGKSSPSSIKYDASSELLSGLAATMQISYNDGPFDNYTGGATTLSLSDEISQLSDGETLVVKVRVKPLGTQPATKPKVFTIYPRAEAPDQLDFDPSTQKILGTSGKMQYRSFKNSVWSGWSGISGATLNVAKLIKDGVEKVEIRVKAVTGKNSASDGVEVSIPSSASP